MLVTIGIAYYYMKRVKKRKNRQIWVHRINLRRREQAISFQALYRPFGHHGNGYLWDCKGMAYCAHIQSVVRFHFA